MSKHDSTNSADNKSRINPHDFFVPVIVIVVLSILIVATFHANEPGSQLASVADTEQAEAAGDTKTVASNHAKSPEVTDASLKTMDKTASSDQSIPRDQAVAAQAVDHADTADTDVISRAQTSTTAGLDGADANTAKQAASTGKLPTDENTPDLDESASSGSGIHAASTDRRQVTNPMQDQRGRLYREAMQAQKAHRMKMLEYRAEVMKRIEQDRRDFYRHSQNSAQQRREHRDRDRDRNRLEQARNGAEDMPI